VQLQADALFTGIGADALQVAKVGNLHGAKYCNPHEPPPCVRLAHGSLRDDGARAVGSEAAGLYRPFR